jgi:hypothetical protein
MDNSNIGIVCYSLVVMGQKTQVLITLYSFTWDYSISLGLFAVTVHHILGILIEARDMVPMCCFVAKIHVAVR